MLLDSLNVSAQSRDEYAVKAVFLFNFAQFVVWPHPEDSTEFTICILGSDPFGSTIDDLAKGKTIKGKPYSIRRLKTAADARSCQIVFISADDKSKASKLIDAVGIAPVLTVAESRDFLRAGGMIELSMTDDHVSMSISQEAAEKTGLKISSRLLALSRN
jgi:hypothetical protein